MRALTAPSFALALLIVGGAGARSDVAPPPAAREAAPSPAPQAPLPPDGRKRPVPRYSSRPESESLLWWGPRLLLFPLQLVSEYVVRQPLGALATAAEKYHWRARAYDFLTFGADNQIGIFPTGRIDTGFRASAGVYFFWNDVVGRSDVRARGVTGGASAYRINASWSELHLGNGSFALSLALTKLPDRAFHGFGPRSAASAARYDEKRRQAQWTYARAWGGRLRFRAWLGARRVDFNEGPREQGDPSIARAIELGLIERPPGLAEGYALAYEGLGVRLDTRPPRVVASPRSAADFAHRSGSGLVLSWTEEHFTTLGRTAATASRDSHQPAWLIHSASAAAAVDVAGLRRTLELELHAEATTALPGDAEIPFTERIALGGSRLSGFRSRRLVDLSAVVAEVGYRWPVWTRLDGRLHLSLGNVFGRHGAGLELGALRSSFGIGVLSAGDDPHPFELILAFGTEPLDAGASVESVRFAIGTRPLF